MNEPQSKDPLHGITLEQIVSRLAELLGWDKLGTLVRIKCFISDPSVKSSLKFLRKTPWARRKVENLFITMQKRTAKKKAARERAAMKKAEWSKDGGTE